MPRVDAVVRCPVYDSFRVQQVAGMFDLPPAAEHVERFSAEAPGLDEPWDIGLVVGPSGSGKSTIARTLWPDAYSTAKNWPSDRAVVDGFAAGSIREITGTLSAVGFSSPPGWIKPYHVLSQGERFRCDLARAILEGGNLVVFDEFTSVVDRTVARIGSAAVSKAVRRMGRRFVAISCHYDIAEWLEPDWVLDMKYVRLSSLTTNQAASQASPYVRLSSLTTNQTASQAGKPNVQGPVLTRRRLRRPEIRLDICRTDASVWPLFAKHHYLNAALNRTAHCYLGIIGAEGGMPSGRAPCTHGRPRHGEPAAFCAVLPLIGYAGRRRISRLVVRGDFQGVGVGRAMLNAVAAMYPRISIVTGHPAMIAVLKNDARWKCTAVRKYGFARQPRATERKSFTGGAIGAASTGRIVCSFERA
jgi:energy-coupling factor transporter ATP-binding protein EcfA2/GNAT superfamily N-acetyltransferase